MWASDARSISVTMSVPVVFVPTSARVRSETVAEERAGRARPARRGPQLGEVGLGVTADTRFRPCPIPSAVWTCAATPSRGPRRRCAGPWPTPRWATTASATIRPWPGWRLPSPSGSARRRRCSCRPARWPTRSPCGVLAPPGTVVLVGRRQHVVVREAAAAGTQRAPPSWWPSTTPTAPSTRRRSPAGWPTPGSGGPSAVGRVRRGHPRRGGWPGLAAGAPRGGRRRRAPDAPRRRPALERRRRLGHHRRRAGRAGDHGHLLRVEGPRRARRLAAGRTGRPGGAGPRRAQAARRRHAAGRDPGGGGPARARSRRSAGG